MPERGILTPQRWEDMTAIDRALLLWIMAIEAEYG